MDGLLLGPDWNWRFDHVQVLAPEYLDAASRAGRETRGWRVIPHFVDPAQFQPASNRQAERARILGSVPPAAHLALAVGDFAPGSSKRLHYIVEEFARIPAGIRPHLLLVGNATVAEHRSLEEFSRRLLGHGVHIRTSLPRSEMAAVYRCADVFVHAALREPFGIVLLEAMASGLPVIGHDFPVTRWIIGEGGDTADLRLADGLAEVLVKRLATPEWLTVAGGLAQHRVRSVFSTSAVLPRYQEAYRSICQGGPAKP
jgi:glycosyltransferase involved in cell wall biosynthesis